MVDLTRLGGKCAHIITHLWGSSQCTQGFIATTPYLVHHCTLARNIIMLTVSSRECNLWEKCQDSEDNDKINVMLLKPIQWDRGNMKTIRIPRFFLSHICIDCHELGSPKLWLLSFLHWDITFHLRRDCNDYCCSLLCRYCNDYCCSLLCRDCNDYYCSLLCRDCNSVRSPRYTYICLDQNYKDICEGFTVTITTYCAT